MPGACKLMQKEPHFRRVLKVIFCCRQVAANFYGKCTCVFQGAEHIFIGGIITYCEYKIILTVAVIMQCCPALVYFYILYFYYLIACQQAKPQICHCVAQRIH